MNDIILGWERADEKQAFGFSHRPDEAQAGRLVSDASEAHVLAIAPTGKGKSRCLAIPNLLHWDGPVIALDIKGELARRTADYRRDVLKQQVVVLDPWGKTREVSGAFNPLDLIPHGEEDVGDDAFMLASMIAPTALHQRDKEPFWNERGQSLLAGVIAAVLASRDNERCLARVYDLLNADDVLYQLAVMLDVGLKSRFATQQIGAFLQTAELTRSGILSTAQSHVRVLAGDRVRKATSTSTFDIDAVTRGDPLSIYIVVPPEKLISHGGLIRLWFSALMALVTRRDVRPERSTLFLLDELAQLGPMPQVQAGVTLSRGYGMRCMMFLQSYSQLRQLYPHDHQALLENCGSLVTFGHTSWSMSVEMAAAMGDISAETLRAMQATDAAMRTNDEDSRLVRRLDYLTDPFFAGRATEDPFFRHAGGQGR